MNQKTLFQTDVSKQLTCQLDRSQLPFLECSQLPRPLFGRAIQNGSIQKRGHLVDLFPLAKSALVAYGRTGSNIVDALLSLFAHERVVIGHLDAVTLWVDQVGLFQTATLDLLSLVASHLG